MQSFKMQYESLRNVTSIKDTKLGRERRCGVALANEFFDIPDHMNVRQFLENEVNGKKIKQHTAVNDAIRETLERNRDDFAMLNGGITIVCDKVHVDDKKRELLLENPSIINGSQTRGVLKDFFKEEENEEDTDYPAVHFEVIVTDRKLAANITIARNFQNRVIPVSTYGAKGIFDKIEASMKQYDPSLKLRKSETDPAGDEYVNTELLIQVITVITPPQIQMPRDVENGIRSYAFSQKALCLEDFAKIMEDEEKPVSEQEFTDARNFFLDVAYDAWVTYEALRSDANFKVFREKKTSKHARRSPVKKNKEGEVVDVAMGILFPIMAALGKFARQDSTGNWQFKIPSEFKSLGIMSDLIKQSDLVFTNGPNDPARMGKDPNSYAALQPIVTGFLKLWKPPPTPVKATKTKAVAAHK